MSGLFDATTITGMALANRFVRSATYEGMAAPDGSSTQALVEVSTNLARGGVGLIITGDAFVSDGGRAGQRELGVHSDQMIPGLAAMTLAVHAAGGKIALQIAQAGLRAMAQAGEPIPLGPSALQLDQSLIGRAMTLDDLAAVKQAFAFATQRAQAAGFDAVQIHAAHGGLLSQFLSPFFNQRADGYGGSVRNRARLVIEVLAAIRAAAGPSFPVLIKVNSEDFLPGGLTVDDMLETAVLLVEAGIDAIELSGGTFLSGDRRSARPRNLAPGEPEAYYEMAAKRYKQEVKAPLMLVGGIRTLETAEKLVAEGVADYISLSRPLICEPGLIERWRSGDRSLAACRSCNSCFVRSMKGKGVICAFATRRSDLSDAVDTMGSTTRRSEVPDD